MTKRQPRDGEANSAKTKANAKGRPKIIAYQIQYLRKRPTRPAVEAVTKKLLNRAFVYKEY